MVENGLRRLDRPLPLQLRTTATLLKQSIGSTTYRFNLNQRSSVTLAVPKPTPALSLTLRDRSGQLLAQTRLGQRNASLTIELAANTYFLRVERRGGRSVYRLRAAAAPLASDSLPTHSPAPPETVSGGSELLLGIPNPAPILVLPPVFSFAKTSTELANLYREFLAYLQAGNPASGFRTTNSLLQVLNGQVIIEATASSDAALLQSDLTALGLEASAQAGLMVSGALPISALNELDSLASLQFIRAAMPSRMVAPQPLILQ
jgi:hypothetical protein